MNRNLKILNSFVHHGQTKKGVSHGPNFLFQNGMKDLIRKAKFDNVIVEDARHIKHDLKRYSKYDEFQLNSFNIFSNPALKGKTDFDLALGGDHSISYGTVSRVLAQRPNVGVVWLDAHPDLNTPETSGSGSPHGMPVAYLMGKASISQFAWPIRHMMKDVPLLQAKNLAYIGLRDVDGPEAKMLDEMKIEANYGNSPEPIEKVIERVLAKLSHCDSLHLSFDVDSLDPSLTPSTGTPVKGGLSIEDAQKVARAMRETGKLRSMDCVEVNPELGSSKDAIKTAKSALKVVSVALGVE